MFCRNFAYLKVLTLNLAEPFRIANISKNNSISILNKLKLSTMNKHNKTKHNKFEPQHKSTATHTPTLSPF